MKPHVIILMADQLRADVLGKGITPNIDSLLEEGVDFQRTYCSCPLCVPARGSFFTGTYPNRNGSLINPWELRDAMYGNVKEGIKNLYEYMESDWDSIHSGKQHLFTEGEKLEKRKDSKTKWYSTEESYKNFLRENKIPMPGGEKFRWRVPELVNGLVTKVSNYSNAETGCYEYGEKYYFDSYFTECALDGLKKRDPSKPLLLNLMFLAPHPPLQIPEPWYSKIEKEDVELPDNVGRYYSKQSPLQMYNLPGIIGSKYDRESWKETWRVYLGLVAMLDQCVGRILEELKRQRIYDDSLIIFTSDHGEMLGSHGLFQKMCMYEEAVRVPLFIKFPKNSGISKKSICQVVEHVDVFATLCDYLDLETPQFMDGKSLLPLIKGEKEEWDETAFIQYDGNGSRSNFQRCVIKGDYKLIVDFFKEETFYELYCVGKDAQEKENLMFQEKYDGIARELAALLAMHMVKTGDCLALPPFQPKKFREIYGFLEH